MLWLRQGFEPEKGNIQEMGLKRLPESANPVGLADDLNSLVAFLIPGLRNLLGLVPLNLEEWLWVGGIALSLLVIVETGSTLSR